MASTRELIFEITEEPEGGYSAEAIGENIFTQGDTWEELRANVLDATKAAFFEIPLSEHPSTVRLYLRKNEVLAVA